MDKRFSAILGLGLILLGGLALMGNMGAPVLGVSLSPFWPFAFLWRETVGRLWPVVVIGLGLLLAAPPVLHPTRRGLGVLFIPALPVLTTGALLLLASLFNWWGLWRWLWPQEVLALALGFLFAAIWMRAPGLAIPAILVGLNGMVFQLCAVTGWWEAWAVLWTIEPLAVGLGLLAAGALAR
jgi:hypothetical protein